MNTPLSNTGSRNTAAAVERPVVASYVATFLKPEMQHIYRQVTALSSFRPIVFTQKRENANAFPFDDIVIAAKPATHQLRRLWQKTILRRPITIYRSEAVRLRAALRRVDARALHIYFGHIGVHLLPLIEICELPVLVSFHGADAQVDLGKPAYLARTQHLLHAATLLLVRSESLRDRLLVLGADPAKIRIHRTGIPLDELRFEQRQPPADGGWHFVQACRLIRKKGLFTSLEAFALFSRPYSRAKFTIAGEGPLLAELQSVAAKLGISERVLFAGFLHQHELRALYRNAHLFLHPSELGPDGDQEGIPNSMLEAMATGLPVVATTHGGIPEAVASGESGLLVPPQDPGALSEAMAVLCSDPERYRAMGVAAAREVRERFDLARQSEVLEAAYAEAIAIQSRIIRERTS